LTEIVGDPPPDVLALRPKVLGELDLKGGVAENPDPRDIGILAIPEHEVLGVPTLGARLLAEPADPSLRSQINGVVDMLDRLLEVTMRAGQIPFEW
jgi:hypothetical protein